MRSPNWFWSSDRFLTFASWQDRAGPFALWPSLMVQTQVDLGAEVQSTRWTFVLGRRRWQLDLARYTPRASAGKIDWTAGPGGVEEMLRWAKKVFRRSWTKADIEKLFVKKPEWRRLVIQSGARHHYVRVLLARELMEQENGSGQVEPLPRAYSSAVEQLASALRMPKADEKAEAEWSNASLDARRRRPFRSLGTVEGQDPMEQLDHLANLLDLPQEVRDLGDARGMNETPVPDTVAAPSPTAPVVPPSTVAPTPMAGLPSYLPLPTASSDEEARLLAASLTMAEDPTHDDGDLARALAAALNAPAASVPVEPVAPAAPPKEQPLPAFLPPGPQDDASRALAEELERALRGDPEPPGH